MAQGQAVEGRRDAHANVCARCGSGFTCGMQAGWAECWCASLPAVDAIPDVTAGCYCPACLKIVLGVADGDGRPGAASG